MQVLQPVEKMEEGPDGPNSPTSPAEDKEKKDGDEDVKDKPEYQSMSDVPAPAPTTLTTSQELKPPMAGPGTGKQTGLPPVSIIPICLPKKGVKPILIIYKKHPVSCVHFFSVHSLQHNCE